MEYCTILPYQTDKVKDTWSWYKKTLLLPLDLLAKIKCKMILLKSIIAFRV